jgi:Domain of unknown function (DUF1844)
VSETPKIIVDTDWKTQAQKEKERLSASERTPGAPSPARQGPAVAPGAPAAEQAAPAPEGQPEATFEELLRLLATQALMYLGAFPDPETGRAIVSLEYAKLHIDLLGVLEKKTRGNLTEQESSLLTRTLHELRMQYVEVARAVAKAVQEGRISGPGAAPRVEPRPAPPA